MVCPITLQCLYAQTVQLPVFSTSACNNPSLEISEKSRLTVDVIVTTIITRVRNRVLYSITHGCDRILPGYCTRKQSARGTLLECSRPILVECTGSHVLSYIYCNRVKVGVDLRSRPTFKRSHMHSFASWTTASRRTPGSRTATNMQSRLGCILKPRLHDTTCCQTDRC